MLEFLLWYALVVFVWINVIGCIGVIGFMGVITILEIVNNRRRNRHGTNKRRTKNSRR